MSRIRSVHPGFFRDDRLVPCSAFARLLFIGLGVEADDKGIFEWKPVTLKMSIFPGDNIEIVALLDELLKADAILQFDADNGKAYGAIRNFRKYQKPKTPNDLYPMPDYVADYVQFPRKEETQSDDQAALPPSGENSPQMEDGEGVGAEDRTAPPVDEAARARAFDEVWKGFPQHPSSSRVRAQRAWTMVAPSDWPAVIEAVKRYAGNFLIECAARKRPTEEGRRYVPPLSRWLESGEWRDALSLSVPGMADNEIIVIDASGPDFEALVKFRDGRKPYVGDSGRITIRKSELEQARTAA